MAANLVTNLAFSATITNEEFRLFGAGISNILNAGGLTKTLDTGQVDWTTAVWPAVNGIAAYETRQFTDPLHSSVPIYFRLVWERTATNTMEIRLSIGKGTNGTGYLTNIIMTEATGFPAISVNHIDWALAVSAGTNRFTIFTYRAGAPATTNILLSVERTADADRTPNSLGLMVYIMTAGTVNVRVVPYTGIAMPTITNASGLASLIAVNQTSALEPVSGHIGHYPLYLSHFGKVLEPSLNLCAAYIGNYTSGSFPVISMRGVNQTMFALFVQSPNANIALNGIGQTAFILLLRHD